MQLGLLGDCTMRRLSLLSSLIPHHYISGRDYKCPDFSNNTPPRFHAYPVSSEMYDNNNRRHCSWILIAQRDARPLYFLSRNFCTRRQACSLQFPAIFSSFQYKLIFSCKIIFPHILGSLTKIKRNKMVHNDQNKRFGRFPRSSSLKPALFVVSPIRRVLRKINQSKICLVWFSMTQQSVAPAPSRFSFSSLSLSLVLIFDFFCLLPYENTQREARAALCVIAFARSLARFALAFAPV